MDTTDTLPLTQLPQGPASERTPALFLQTLKQDAKPELRWAAAASLLGVVGLLLFCLPVAWIINASIDASKPPGWWWAMALLGLLVRYAAHLFRDRMGQTLSARIRSRLRAQLLDSATQLGPFGLATQGNAAWWAHQYLEQIDALHGYLARYLPARLSAVIVPLCIIAIVFSVDWIAGLLLLLATPIIPVFMALIGWGTESVHQSQQEKQAALASHLLERLEALPWLRRQGAIEETAADVEVAANEYRRVSMRVLRVAFLSSATLEFFSAVSIGLLAIYIGFSLVGLFTFGPSAVLTLASGLFILLLAPECFLPLRLMAQAHHDMTAAKAAAQSLTPWLPGPVDSHGTSNQPEPCDRPNETCLDMNRVSFSFGNDSDWILHNVSCTLKEGQILGVSGPSGSGKSTLLALVAGFLSPTEGRIARASDWSWLNQRPYLFHETLRANLLLARQDSVTDDKLLAVLRDAGITLPDPSLPQGLDTPIGELNRGVSGGQAQRVALARALLKGARLWVLDEPTAALDETTRNALIDTLVEAARKTNTAVIMATHDPKLLAACDHVMTLTSRGIEAEPMVSMP